MRVFGEECVEKPKQLRGEVLEEFLVSQLHLWWMSCVESGVPFAYSQLEFSKKTGVSRETIRKKQSVLDATLIEMSASRSKLDRSKRRQKDLVEIERLKFELQELRDRYRCLQIQHVTIFSALLNHGIDLRALGLHGFQIP
jgi:hypothetical protein